MFIMYGAFCRLFIQKAIKVTSRSNPPDHFSLLFETWNLPSAWCCPIVSPFWVLQYLHLPLFFVYKLKTYHQPGPVPQQSGSKKPYCNFDGVLLSLFLIHSAQGNGNGFGIQSSFAHLVQRLLFPCYLHMFWLRWLVMVVGKYPTREYSLRSARQLHHIEVHHRQRQAHCILHLSLAEYCLAHDLFPIALKWHLRLPYTMRVVGTSKSQVSSNIQGEEFRNLPLQKEHKNEQLKRGLLLERIPDPCRWSLSRTRHCFHGKGHSKDMTNGRE